MHLGICSTCQREHTQRWRRICAICGQVYCEDCGFRCLSCSRHVCDEHRTRVDGDDWCCECAVVVEAE